MELNIVERRSIGLTCARFQFMLKSQIIAISKFIPNLPNPVIESISKIPASDTVSIIAAIYKESDLRFTSIRCLASGSNEDLIYIQDETGRILTTGIPADKYVSGVIIGVTGQLLISESFIEFNVFSITEPSYSKALYPIVRPKCKIAIVSDLQLDSNDFDVASSNLCFSNLEKDISLFIIIGNTFSLPEDTFFLKQEWEQNIQLTDTSPIEMLTTFCENINCKKLIVPGKNDPTSLIWPQNPIDPILFQEIDDVESVSNPTKFSINNISFVCCTGDVIEQIQMNTSFSFIESQVAILRWGLMSPSIPFQVHYSSGASSDIVFFDEMPNFFVSGNADTFAVTVYNGCHVVSVPKYFKYYSIVVIDLESGDISLRGLN
ncbi:DNA polymerase delta small subunit [Histomonas meleagridis]|uniref:DNA polymerase delta small subunit n=1 Tax=Histomonas meleagridis TaxID=135588 RepID=UPI00355A7215|nr:DNA polymerase delta small subunit [Histomonas meleagridis]KAH0796972.1 DNA polymerase delta small subunit [Histomonas meleagridis]